MGRETAWTGLRVAFAARLWTLGVRDNRGSAGAKGGGNAEAGGRRGGGGGTTGEGRGERETESTA